MTDDGKARPHFLDDRCHRGLAHIDEHELELPARLRGQTLQAFAQTLRAPHRSHDDRDGRIQCRALLTESRHGNDKFHVFFGDEILRGISRAAVLVFFLSHDHQLRRRFEIEANFSAGTILWRGCFSTSSGVRSTKSILETLSPSPFDCIIL